jgi:hypothetical protein
MSFAEAYADQTEKDWEELKITRKPPAKKSTPVKMSQPAKKQAKPQASKSAT